jgi:GNAT superfamily N-acetyltransferase
MQDMLVRLYDLPDAAQAMQRAEQAGFQVRRAAGWDRIRLREFIRKRFQDVWAMEADRAFAWNPITCYIGTERGEIVGFAVYECTMRDYFGPTGVREDLRGKGLGAALLLACLNSMREMGYAYAVIGAVDDAAGFYEKTVGATFIEGSDPGIFATLPELRGEANA